MVANAVAVLLKPPAAAMFTLVVIAGSSGTALAQSCKSSGGLVYLGNTTDESKSVWLSGTQAGSFALEAAQGNTTVDTWDRSRRGLHVSTSPFVSSGNGGTHKLYETSDNKPCLIDTQNQKGGFQIPPNINLPMVTSPGHVLPPIGSFFPDFHPPSGLMPTRPALPGLPGARPPTGVMPTLPGGVQPPIGTLPPGGGTGGTPGAPGTRPPGVTVQASGQMGGRLATGQTPQQCIDPRSSEATSNKRTLPICPPELLAAAAAARYGEVPLTEGRDLVRPSLWNAWAEGSLVGTNDGRYGLDLETLYGSMTFGVDRRMTDNVVAGLSFSIDRSRTTGYGDLLHADTDGFSIGPYVAVRLSPHWALDASLTYGRYDNDIELSILDGSYDSQRYSGAITLHGQFTAGEYFIRPKASVNYSHIESDQYTMSGDILGLPVNVRFPEDSFNYGVLEASAEISRIFPLKEGKYVMPFAELGANYEFERPNGGQILTADLKQATPSPWSFSLKVGARMLRTNSLQLEASAAYLSFGQNGLDIWEGKLHLSYAF